MLRRISSCGIILAALLGTAMARQDTKRISIKPNKEVQSFLHALSSTNLQERQKLFPARTKEEFKEKLRGIEEMSGGPQGLVAQLLYFRVRAKSTMEAMMPVVIIEQLGISRANQAAGILPYLETGDASVLKEAYEWLEGIDYNRATKKYDLSRYKETIRNNRADVPLGLIKYMYQKDAESGLSILATVYLKKDEAKALVDKVKAQDEPKVLEQLSHRTEWWAHLYVAEKMRRNPKLRSSGVMERLKKSKHPLVQEAVQEILKRLCVAEKMRKNPKRPSSAAKDRVEESKHPLKQEPVQEIEKP